MTRKLLSWQPVYSITKKPERKRRGAAGKSTLREGELVLDLLRGDHREPLYSLTGAPLTGPQCVGNGPVSRASMQTSIGEDNHQDAAEQMKSSEVALVKAGPSLENFLDSGAKEALQFYQPVEFVNLAQKYGPLLNRYNHEFCKIPLTANMRVNPFQYDAEHGTEESSALLHAVMALAGHHVCSPETQPHRNAALQLIRTNVCKIDMAKHLIPHLLDAIVILFSLDETQSAMGNWSTHLTGAHALLEICGGPTFLASSARMRAQAAVLVWWDAIIGLAARDDCVFPYAYAEAVLAVECAEWDFFSLCGCPLALVNIVMRLTHLSAEKSKTASMHFVSFNMSCIDEVEELLQAWRHVPSDDIETEEQLHIDLDKMHCSEAWRYGLLLYVYRVFRWRPGQLTTLSTMSTARNVIDHVSACRDSEMISRQALLPLILAGCEIRDKPIREKTIQLCQKWDRRTRYHLFCDAVPLMREVWNAQESLGFENTWWGEVIDKKHQQAAQEGISRLQTRICFG